MSDLTTTMGAMTGALADVPESATAWVPLRRATVEAALRHLDSLQTVVDALRYLGYADVDVQPAPAPAWRYPVLSAEDAASQGERAFIADEVHMLHAKADAGPAPSNGTAISAAPIPSSDDKPTNAWRRRPLAERLEIVRQTIAELATNGWLTQLDFDRRKPEYMPSGSAHVATFRMSWRDLVQSALPKTVAAPEPDAIVEIDEEAQLRMAMYNEMRRLAVGPNGPSKTRWDDERSPSLPKSDDLIERFGARWVVLLQQADLLPPGTTLPHSAAAKIHREGVAAETAEPFRE